MNILYAVHAYKPAYRVGGPVISVSAAAEALVRRGHQVTVVTTNSNLDEDLDVDTDRPIDVNGVSVWYFRREEPLQRVAPFVTYLSKSIGFLYCPAMRDALDRIVPGIDIVDTHMPFVYPTYAAAHAAFRNEKPLFYHQRGTFDPQRLRFRAAKKKLYIRLIERPILRRATTLIALTDAERESFHGLAPAVPVEVVPNGIDVPPLRPGVSERVRARYGIDQNAFVILFLGRLHPTKGADKLLEAFSRIAASEPDAVLVMAGPDEWKLEEQWRAAAGDLQRGRVFFPGMVAGHEKADLLARADLFSLPSIGEGFSIAVLEALASGTAVMLSPGCHFPEVEAAGAGVVVDADAGAMATVLSDLCAQRARVLEMGERGKRLVSERYSWDAITDRLLDVYTDGLQRWQKRAGRSGG
jgi:glycosyltransferase involved in cell wall biosynthesis